MKISKKQIFDFITKQDDDTGIEAFFNNLIVVLIVTNTLAIIIQTFDNIPSVFSEFLKVFEIISVLIFTAEYLARFLTAEFLFPHLSPTRARLKYIFSFMSLVDLLAILPFYLPLVLPIDFRVLRTLRLVRLFRVFKLNRYTESLQVISRVFKNKAAELISSIFVVVILIIIASVIMYDIENEFQPEVFTNFFSSVWWAIATLTTVGYGDIYPITPLGKILSAVIALLGIGLVALPTGIISSGFMGELKVNKAVHKEGYCPCCGKKVDE